MSIQELGLLFKEKIRVLISVIIAFIAPIKPLMIVVGLFIVIDTITGIYKVFKTKEKFSSRKLSRTISKMVLYQACIILIFSLDKLLLGELISSFVTVQFFTTKVVAMFLVTVELISIKENIKAATKVDIWEKFKGLLRRAKEEKDEFQNF